MIHQPVAGSIFHPPVDTIPPTPPVSARSSRSGSADQVSKRAPSDLPSTTFQIYPSSEPFYPQPPHPGPKSVLPVDQKTPDSHVERDERLVRLTGSHPFNAEAPLNELYDEGFITSENLHYVRNHGPVPRCEDGDAFDWVFTVEGMVAQPLTLSLKDLLDSHEQLTYPVTLVCAGNRRKEQNVVRKTKGFSWGPAGLSTALWTGTPISDLLIRAGPLQGAKYVCFEGADKLPNGCYGTSVKLSLCMDAQKGILVAHRMNGRMLQPDHGKPVRVVVPGQIGGRSVKWLKRILVTAEPSDNWYHIYDNRVLPTIVTPEASAADMLEMWKDERYAIYSLNTNSAICYPAHDEVITLRSRTETYKVQGYAYSGGGKRVTRMEVTLDRGKCWRLANVHYPEDRYRLAPTGEKLCGGSLDVWRRESSFCWCFWEIDVSVADLETSSDIMARGMDEDLMVQPRDMYWNVLGMMNNPWMRVVIHKEEQALRFEHPTQPGLMRGGWMTRVKEAGGNLTNGLWGETFSDDMRESQPCWKEENEVCMTDDKIDRTITVEELMEHTEKANPWFVVNGHVYDATPFLEEHPGGEASILSIAGKDATDDFMAIHSENAKALMPKYHIGRLDNDVAVSLSGEENDCDPRRDTFLVSHRWTRAVLRDKFSVSADTKIFRFELHHPGQTVGLPVGQHLMIRLRNPATRKTIIRSYTPISQGTDQGVLDLLIKIYHETSDKAGGKMTPALDSVPIGCAVDMKGPTGDFQYLGKGLCAISGTRRRVRRFNMICAGSGVTPIFQVLRALSKDPQDPTECVLLNGNRTEDDILCRSQLKSLVDSAGHRCRLLHTLTNPSASWLGRRGRIDRALIEAQIGSREKGVDDMVLVCGPQTLQRSVRNDLKCMGWPDTDVFVF
ncbi:hypothetical protein CDD83_3393 [Cordyceps sp. RAO-2017]|nr:hypothetical protein CDD83_3393 [Cordyceps sp. RAO-2017]